MAGPVLINARAASRRQIGGVERWTREMAERLPALRPGSYVVAHPPPGLAHRAGQIWEQLVLPGRALRLGAGAIFCPANLAPLLSRRNVVVLHDVSALRRPDWYSRSYAAWQRWAIPRIARRACRIVTVSQFSRDEIVDLLGVGSESISVIAGGVDERFSPAADAAGAAGALHLPRPYVLSVATNAERKNLEGLEVAAERLRARGIDLVVAGGSRAYLPTSTAPRGGVRMLGYVQERHLPGLYAGARAFILPSRYEGFGLPCLEAMASGLPVVAARAGALPETCGDAALLVDPADAAGFADALERCTTDPRERERMCRAGLHRAARFTWDRAARECDALLRGLAGCPA